MKTALKLLVNLSEVDKEDTPLVGGKSANLGEMIKEGFPVPPGFALTTHAYDLFLEENNLNKTIYAILKTTNVNNPDELNQAALKVQNLIKRGKIPEEIVKEVYQTYKKLSGLRSALVAVRSSATAEDMPKTSFAGQQITFLNIKGEANLLNAIRNCWASLFTARSVFYRVENKISHDLVKVSVIIQKMLQSEVSGVIFTIDPVTNEKDRIVIEAVWGLGEMIVQGSVIPDRYVVQKETFKILSKEISDQQIQLIKVGGETKEVQTPRKTRGKQKISDEEIIQLAKLADKLHRHYFFAQDAEWAKEKGKLYLVQTRPVTTLHSVQGKPSGKNTSGLTPILVGVPASPGVATGMVKVLKSPKEIKKIEKGDILVAKMTSPDYVPAMKKAGAIITDEGGLTSHAAIVSRELGLPCIVGTKEATIKLTDKMEVTVDGEVGEIYLGSKTIKTIKFEPTEKLIHTKTATKLYVNLGEPEKAKETARLPVDGVGLLRAEFMMSGIGLHPKEAIKLKKQDFYVNKLAEGIETFCKYFDPRPVIYRASDFKTNEYRALTGGKYWEPEEPNPMLGFRGASRYLANPDVFTLELTALKKVREKYNNLHLMVPYVRSPEELAKVRKIVANEGFFKDLSFKFWMMVELPINVILIEDFIKVGLDGISIGSNDLTMLLLGTDRDNAEVAATFNERSPAVLWSIKRVIKKCSQHHITTSICGQAPSLYDDFVESLVKMGITSLSVNPDAVFRVKNAIVEAEKNL